MFKSPVNYNLHDKVHLHGYHSCTLERYVCFLHLCTLRSHSDSECLPWISSAIFFFIARTSRSLTISCLPAVSQYINAFAYTQLCGVLCAPWNGFIMDRHKGKPRAEGTRTTPVEPRHHVVIVQTMILTFCGCESMKVGRSCRCPLGDAGLSIKTGVFT